MSLAFAQALADLRAQVDMLTSITRAQQKTISEQGVRIAAHQAEIDTMRSALATAIAAQRAPRKEAVDGTRG